MGDCLHVLLRKYSAVFYIMLSLSLSLSLPPSPPLSLQHTLDADERDNPFFPRSGYRVKMSQEVAGLGGDTLFGKAEMQTEVHKEIFRNWVRFT